MVTKLFSPGSALAYLVLLVLGLFLVELPPWLLDILLTANLLLSLVLFLRGIFLKKSIELYSFPTVLVLTTLVRLALNVSSVKLILLHGDKGLDAAGKVIQSFGSYVVQGDFIVGAIIFAIIAVINFVVVAKGSARVAEVAARFALDALPGRQMAIDADLRSGSLTREEAAKKRDALATESQFFGALDGAMKWVQGDAIAGLVLAAVNAIGGVAIGISRGLTVSEAVSTFGVLTIGDGLVTIIPSLLVSLSSAILVARVAGPTSRSTAEDVMSQVFGGDKRALLISGQASMFVGLMGLFGLMPFPATPFLLVGIGLLLLAGVVRISKLGLGDAPKTQAKIMVVSNLKLEHVEDSSDKATSSVTSNVVIEVSSRLIAWPSANTNLFSRGNIFSKNQILLLADSVKNFSSDVVLELISKISRETKEVCGLELPEISFRGQDHLAMDDFLIYIKGTLVFSGKFKSSQEFVVTSKNYTSFYGLEASSFGEHPLTACRGFWADVSLKRKVFEALEIEILNPIAFTIYQAVASVLDNLEMLFGAEEVKNLVRAVNESSPGLIDEIFKEHVVSYSELAELLRALLRERVNIRDLKTLLEGVLAYVSKNPFEENRAAWLVGLHVSVRAWLARTLYQGMTSNGMFRVFMLAAEIEEMIREGIEEQESSDDTFVLGAEFSARLKSSIINVTQPLLERGVLPAIVLCDAKIRNTLQEFVFRQMLAQRWLRVVSIEELPLGVKPELVSVITV